MASASRGTRADHCVVCLEVLKTANVRRRIGSDSSKHVFPVLQSLGYSGSLPAPNEFIFLCRACFRDAEKITRLRVELKQLEQKFSTFLSRSISDHAQQRGKLLYIADITQCHSFCHISHFKHSVCSN